jgi:peptidylprolyl isomerase
VLAVAVVLLVVGIILALVITFSAGAPAATAPMAVPTPADAAPTAAPAAAVTSDFPAPTTRTYAAPPPQTIDPSRAYTATITTPRGEIVVELLPDIAPQTVNNFVFLARDNFYNGLTWHRVLPGFMAQGGDPLGDGTGGPGYSVPGEFTNTISFDQPGWVAMARSNDPDSAGSQFFITTGPAQWLDGQYTIFGRVLSGQEIVNDIPLRDPSNPNDLGRPGETILGITISES